MGFGEIAHEVALQIDPRCLLDEADRPGRRIVTFRPGMLACGALNRRLAYTNLRYPPRYLLLYPLCILYSQAFRYRHTGSEGSRCRGNTSCWGNVLEICGKRRQPMSASRSFGLTIVPVRAHP